MSLVLLYFVLFLVKQPSLSSNWLTIKQTFQNFLGIGAAKVKAARNARKAAQIGFDRSKNSIKVSNTGTGVPLDQVLRFKYQKGFTQAVRLPCTKKDLLM